MNTTLRSLAAAALFALAASCGGATDDATGTDDLSRFEPIAAFAQVKKAAAPYTTNLTAVSLQAQRRTKGSAKGVTAYSWVWTAMGQDGMFVDVQVSASGATVLAHERRMLFAGEVTFDPTAVLVDGGDVLALANLLGLDQPSALALGATLATEKTGARWTVNAANGTLIIDGATGKTCGN